jgi:transketolase
VRDTFIKVLLNEARKNPDIFLITGDLGFGVLDDFAKELPNQFLNAGVAEQAMMSMAAGIASTGKRVFVYSIANFPTLRCLEQIRNDVCVMNNSVVIVSVGAGYSYGSHGYTHHAIEDLAAIRTLPNIEIFSPGDPVEAEAVTKLIMKKSSPAYLRLGKNGEANFTLDNHNISENRFRELRSGSQGTLVFTGSVGQVALKAAEVLKDLGISVAVASVPFPSRLDDDYLRNALAKGPLVTIEEHAIRGGFGSAVLEKVHSMSGVNKNRIGLIAANQDDISLVGTQDYLRTRNGITDEAIVAKFKALLVDQA